MNLKEAARVRDYQKCKRNLGLLHEIYHMHLLHYHVFSYLTLLGINDSPGTVIDRGQARKVESTTVDYQL